MKTRIPRQPETISPIYKSPLQLFIVLIALEVLVFMNQYVHYGLDNFFVPSLSAFIALSLVTPWIAKYLYKTFLSLKSAINDLTESDNQEWFTQQTSLIFGINRWSVLITIIIAMCAVATDYLIWGGWGNFSVNATYYLHLTLLFSILGNLGWSYWGILLFAQKLDILKFDLEPFETKRAEFDHLNSAFLKMLGWGIILYIGAVIAGWLALRTSILAVPIMKFWIFPLAFMVIAFFIAIQFFLHQLMRKAKSIRIGKISTLINSHYQEWEKSQSSVEASAINELLTWKDKIEKEREFPFDFLTIASVIVTVLIPTLQTIKELFA